MFRIRNYAAPTNAMRLGMKSPCVTTSFCEECSSPDRIGNTWTVTEKSFPKARVKVVLINEDLVLWFNSNIRYSLITVLHSLKFPPMFHQKTESSAPLRARDEKYVDKPRACILWMDTNLDTNLYPNRWLLWGTFFLSFCTAGKYS